MNALCLGLPPPSRVYCYEDKKGFLGENIVIESPVLTGKIAWFVHLYVSLESINFTL